MPLLFLQTAKVLHNRKGPRGLWPTSKWKSRWGKLLGPNQPRFLLTFAFLWSYLGRGEPIRKEKPRREVSLKEKGDGMIRLIEALNYRCLRYIRQPLERFHVLIGPNASGKTTFLDVVSFLGRLVSDGLDAALEERTSNFQDLVWHRQEGPLELAIEAAIPEPIRDRLPNLTVSTRPGPTRCRG